jgi:subtilisin family serine protease
LVRSIFAETEAGNNQMPNATPGTLGTAIIECINAGAQVINMSVALALPSSATERELEEALDYATKRGVLVVAAAGNQGTVGGTAITRHPWVIPVAACDLQGRPITQSNMGSSIGRQGLSAPGDGIISLGSGGQTFKAGGTSIAAPFVTGAIALLWSEFPAATATQIKLAVTQASGRRRATVIPPLLDAWASYQFLLRAGF